MVTADWRALYPFTSRYLDVPGGRLHYLDEGAGETLVMVHGNPTWSFYYRRLIAEFRASHRVIVPDHLGCGLSDKPQAFSYRLRDHIDNLERLLERTPNEPLTLIVHDWGGAIGLGYAARHPERVARLVILNTAAFRSSRIPLRIAACRIPGFGPLAVRGFNAFARCALFMATNHPERLTPAIRAGLVAPYDSWAHRVAVQRFVEDIPLSPQHPSYATLTEVEAGLAHFVQTPLLIQWGARDWCFNDHFLAEWRERFPQAEVDVYADAGHYVLEDAHERIIPRLKAFLEA